MVKWVGATEGMRRNSHKALASACKRHQINAYPSLHLRNTCGSRAGPLLPRCTPGRGDAAKHTSGLGGVTVRGSQSGNDARGERWCSGATGRLSRGCSVGIAMLSYAMWTVLLLVRGLVSGPSA